MKLTSKNGTLRITDGSQILHGTTPLHTLQPDVVKFDGVATYENITAAVEADDVLFTTAFLTDTNDAVFIGSTINFNQIQFILGAGSNYAVASGALKIFYYNGTDFSSQLTIITDGTLSTGDCFGQDGIISFRIPTDWIMGGNANLDADKFYVMAQTTTAPTTPPDADVLNAIGPQFYNVPFVNSDFSAPIQRPLKEEVLVLNRNTIDSYAHYTTLTDDQIYEPLPLTFSIFMDDLYYTLLKEAINCGNPSSTNWTSAGTTTKGSTKNDGANSNPLFKDSSKKSVNVQVIWEGTSSAMGVTYNEVYFPPTEQSMSEADDAITLSINGGIYGTIFNIINFIG